MNLHLITSPFSALAGWLVDDELTAVDNLQRDYGYNQSIGIYDQDYTEGSGQNYEDVISKDGSRKSYITISWMNAGQINPIIRSGASHKG